jgi:hypothetical protein
MAQYEIVPTEPAHVRELGSNLRAADRSEVVSAGMTGQRALWRSYRAAYYSATALVDGEVAAIWGAGGSPLGKIGRPWLLTSPAVEKARYAILRVGRAETAKMLNIYPEMRGFVDSRYKGALRLLEGLGFDLSEPMPFGPLGAPFCQYWIRRMGSASTLA